MNLILNTPLPTSLLAKDYDNKILMTFLALMLFLMFLGVLFINFSASKTSLEDEEKTPSIILST